MRPNDVLIWIILLEMIFILFFINKSELAKETIENILPSNEFKMIMSIGSIITSLYASHYVSHVIQTHYKINYALMMMFIWLTIMIYLEHKMSSSLNYSDTVVDLQSALDSSHTGDFVFFRSYVSSDICDYIIFRVVSSIINVPFFSHVGMIVKINGVAYLLETSSDINHCIHANKMKGGVKLIKAYDKINNAHGIAYLSRNNLHNYIRDEDIIPFMDKYGHLSFLDNYVMCVTIICMFLHFANVFKNEQTFMRINELNNPEVYACDFKNIENIQLTNKYYYDNLQNK